MSQWLIWHEQGRRPPFLLSPHAIAFTFNDSLDARCFRQAFQSVVDRSDALRTVFVEEGGQPQRYVLPRLPQAMDIVDLSAAYQPHLAYAQWHAERDLRSLSPALRTFDSTLVRLGDQHYVWRLALHRLIADSYSLYLIYARTAEAYAAALAGALDALEAQAAFEDYAAYDRQALAVASVNGAELDALALDAGASTRSHLPFPRSLPVPGDRYAMDLGEDRTAALRRAAADLSAESTASGAAEPPAGLRSRPDAEALFILCAAALTALTAQMRGCRTVCLDTEVDIRHCGSWAGTIGRISRPHSFAIDVAHGEGPSSLLSRVKAAFAEARRQIQIAPIAERPAAQCRVLLLVEDMTFGPFGKIPVRVERLDACYSQRKPREQKESRLEPSLCLSIDSYASTANLRITFTCCGHLAHGRSNHLAQEYIRLLDALLAAREQPVRNTR